MNDAVDSEAIVDVRSLQKVYGGWSFRGRRQIKALRGVTLQACKGEVFGLLGPNGAGKTTLIKILLGVVKPSGGSAYLFNQAVGSAAARRRVGYLPESLRVERHHTARTALRYYGRMSRMSPGEIARRSDELLELVGLQGRDRESVRRFSKGMYQRLGLAQALMHDPDLLVLDEPTDGLDPVGRNDVRRVIERLSAAGKTIFLNSHLLQEVELVCSRVAILAGGQIRGAGRIEELSGQARADRVIIDVHPAGAEDPSRLIRCFESARSDQIKIEMIPHCEALRATVTLENQADIDRAVDNLRAARFSISRLQVQHPSLEDTFIRLVGATDASALADFETSDEHARSRVDHTEVAD